MAAVGYVAGVADPGKAGLNEPGYSLGEIHRAGVRPVIGSRDQSGANRIIPDIVPLLGQGFVTSHQVIEELGLPERSGFACPFQDALGGPLLPFADCSLQRIVLARHGCDEEMHMVRHHDIASDKPAVSFAHAGPFFQKNGMYMRIRQERPATDHACRDEKDRLFLPDKRKTSQMPRLRHDWMQAGM